MPEDTPPSGPDAPATIRLRLLQTTDVHGHLLPYDYYTDTGDQPWGLARVASLIARARAERGAENCLLLDSGDFLQGTPLTDMTAQPGHGWRDAHPVISAMNRLGYDAAAVGNHEFNFGLDWLTETLAQARFPVLCANAVRQTGADPTGDKALLPPCTLLTRHVSDTNGHRHILRIGLIGLVPPQIMTWDRCRLAGRLSARDMVEAAQAWVPRLRAAGADIVCALAHTGIASGPDHPMMENAAGALARIAGIDAVLAGHSHERFPRPAAPDSAGADAARATLHGTPCLMAGFRADHLGQMDLTLLRDATRRRWRIGTHTTTLRAARDAPPCPAFCAGLDKAHRHTLALTARVIGHSPNPLHSYLALVRDDPAVRLVNRAQRHALARALEGGRFGHLPVLSASAPFKTGGRGGPGHFTDIPAGPLRLRHIADLYGFPNTLCGLLISGAQLRDWLERVAGCFNRILPGQADQPLLNPAFPGHDFDVIDGLHYVIDPSAPARYDATGQLCDPHATRIVDLRHAGQPVADDAQFVIAVNSHRAEGGGLFPRPPGQRLVLETRQAVRDLICQHLTRTGGCAEPMPQGWRLAEVPGASVTIETGPGLRRYPQDLAALGATDLGVGETGFLRLRLPLPGASGRGPPIHALANPGHDAYVTHREVGAGRHLANPVRSGRKQP